MSTSTVSSSTAAPGPPPAAEALPPGGGPESASASSSSASSLLPPWRVDIPMTDMSLDSFIYWKEQQRQRTIVNTRNAMAHTPCIYFSTRRVTSSDIVSMITTTMPIGPGQLKEDIGPMRAEGKRRALDKPLKASVVQTKTPLEAAQSMAHLKGGRATEEERAKINQGLWQEQRVFMEKLHRKRAQRRHLERYAATLIQSRYRGHSVRNHWPKINAMLVLRKVMRADLREYLKDNRLVLQGAEFRRRKLEKRQQKAVVIQSAYRRLLSYRAFERKKLMRLADRKREGAVMMQCLVRRWRACMLVKKLRDRLTWERRQQACVRIQAAFRASLGRKKHCIVKRMLRDQAAIMIQCAFRRQRAQRRAKLVRSTSQDKSREFGAKSIQRVCRGFVGRQRVKRLRAERREARRAKAILTLQTTFRKWLGKGVCQMRRARMRQTWRLWAVVEIQRVGRGFVGRRRALHRKLLLSIDVWVQIRLGQAELVEDAYTGVNTDQPLNAEIKDPQGNTMLIMAARHGHLTIVRKCLQWGVPLNAMNQKGQTALHVAIAHRHAAVAEYLLSKPDALINKSGRTLLHEAAKGGLHQCALTLVNYGVDVDSVDPLNGRTAMHEACKHDNPHILRLLLRDSKSVNSQDKEGRTPLHWAADRGAEDCVNQLIEAGANVRMVDGKGRPAIIYAMLGGFVSVVQELEACWYSPKDIKVQEWTQNDLEAALTLADKGESGLLEQLLGLGMPVSKVDASTQDSMLLRAASAAQRAVIDLCLSKGANLSATNPKQQTFLHLCLSHPASHWDLDLPSLVQPSLMNLADKDGRLPIHYAAMNGYPLEPLFSKGNNSQVDAKDIRGRTSLHYAAESLNLPALQSLLSRRASVVATDEALMTPAHLVVSRAVAGPSGAGGGGGAGGGVKDCLAVLLKAGAPLQVRDKQGLIPLLRAAVAGNRVGLDVLLAKATAKEKVEAAFAAVRGGQVGSLETILGSGGDINVRDDTPAGGGVNLLGAAIVDGRYEVVRWLVSQGVDTRVPCESSTGRTALHLVGWYDTVKDLDQLFESGRATTKNLEDKDGSGYTPVASAILAKNYGVADALIKRGALARPALQAGTWGWVLATVKRQEKCKASKAPSF